MKSEIYPRLAESGVIRKDYMVPEDFYSQLSIANSAKNSINSELEYFETKENAFFWYQTQKKTTLLEKEVSVCLNDIFQSNAMAYKYSFQVFFWIYQG